MQIKLSKEEVDKAIQEYISNKMGGEVNTDTTEFVKTSSDGEYYVYYDYILTDIK